MKELLEKYLMRSERPAVLSFTEGAFKIGVHI